MATIEINVDAKAIEDLAADLTRAKRQLVGRLGERGYQLLSEEVPYEKGNLKQGVAAPEVDYEQLTATLTVSARSARIGATTATVVGADGEEKKKVTLKARPAYNYADVVARGNKDAVLRPKSSKAFLIPVPTAPTKGGYLIAGGQIFVVRKTRKAQKPNPFHERAADRLEKEAPTIAEAVLSKFV